jgi:threonine/homoserine/homoserine lactone efflux protein
VSLLVAMCALALSMSISPGPVNMVIISSSASHGLRRTLPFVSGATIGFTLLLVFVGFWLMQAVGDHPVMLRYLEFAGAAFMTYVGFRIASSSPDLSLEQRNAPTFIEGFLLQWLNPKAWIACASGTALFSRPDTRATMIAFVAVYFVICYASLGAWAVLGDRVSILLRSRARIRCFNLVMGGLLILTAFYLVSMQITLRTA